MGSDLCRDGIGGDDECDNDEKIRAEISIIESLLRVASDGSPLVRAEVAVGTWFLIKISSRLSNFFISFRLFVCIKAKAFYWQFLLRSLTAHTPPSPMQMLLLERSQMSFN